MKALVSLSRKAFWPRLSIPIFLLAYALLWTPCEVQASKLYWIDWSTGTTNRADLDGTNAEEILSGLGSPTGVAVDPVCRKLYVSQISGPLIKSGLDGSSVTPAPSITFTSGVAVNPESRSVFYMANSGYGGVRRSDLGLSFDLPVALSVGGAAVTFDPDGRKVYWVNYLGGLHVQINRADPDGSNLQTIVDNTDNNYIGQLAIDPDGGKIYWPEIGAVFQLRRANLDGTNIETIYEEPSSGFPSPWALALDLANSKLYWSENGVADSLVKRSNLDGSGLETVINGGLGRGLTSMAILGDGEPVRIYPRQGGDTGPVSVSLGVAFTQGVSVTLRRSGEPDIQALMVAPLPEGGCDLIGATFDLTGRTQGAWDVVVDFPDGTQSVSPGGFTVEQGETLDISMRIMGSPLLGFGRPQTYTVTYSNRSNIDALGVPLWIAGIPKNATVEPLFDTVDLPGVPVPPAALPVVLDGDQEKFLPLLIPRIPGGAQGSLALKITVPAGTPLFQLRAWTSPPLFSESGGATAGHLASRSRQRTVEDQLAQVLLCGIKILRVIGGVVPGLSCGAEVLEQLRLAFQGIGFDQRPRLQWQMLATIVFTCVPDLVDPEAKIVSAVVDALRYGVSHILNFTNAVFECKEALRQVSAAVLPVQPVGSRDPNEKFGTKGAGEDGYVSLGTPLNYTIGFENLSTASAPAQEVVVTDQLDPQIFDLDGVSVQLVGFGSSQVLLPPGTSQFGADIDLRPARDLVVNVSGDLDRNSGLLTCQLRGLDPSTGQLPTNPLIGFLPPNATPPEGEGSVVLTVNTRTDLSTGSLITNSATIRFDANDPLQTGSWQNRVDRDPPTSRVLPLPPTQNVADFWLDCEGNDVGSGIGDFQIFVSIDGSGFEPFNTPTSQAQVLFSGEPGHSYAFASIASDAVGNLEVKPLTSEATTAVSSLAARKRVAGKKFLLRDEPGDSQKRLLKIVSADPGIDPAGFSAPPTTAGAVLGVTNTLTGESAALVLPASGWQGLGNPAGSQGYSYRANTVCQRVLLKRGRFKAVCQGQQIAFTLNEPAQDSLWATVKVGNDLPLCMYFGGQVTEKVAGSRGTAIFSAKNAPPPPDCLVVNF